MKILDELVIACRTMNFAPDTEQCYRDWVEDYLRFHKGQAGKWIHPKDLRESAVECYLSYLAVNRQLASSTQTQAMCALVFFYRRVMKEPLGEIAAYPEKGGTGFQPVRGETMTRRNLPHIQHPGRSYHVIFRTQSFSLPESARRIALDACLFWNGRKTEIHAAVVMPDHIHILLTPKTTMDGTASVSLSHILHSIKSFSANAINAHINRMGRLWMDESYDRYIRSESDFEEKYEYIRNNPVRAGLVDTWDKYEYLYLPWD